MRRIALASSLSFAFAVAACGPSGGGSSGGSTGSSAARNSAGSSGTTGAGGTAGRVTGSSTGGSAAQGTSNGAGSTGGGNAGATTGGNGGSSGGSSAGGTCDVPDDNPCQLTGGYGFCCLGICTDPQSDPNNCGQCYQSCQGSQTCSQGNCTFPNCDGAPNGALCAGNQGSQDPSQQCVDGICVAVSCSGAQGATECELAGDAGYGSCCDGQCSGFDDATNCGGCGLVCPTGAACVGGACSSSCVDAGCPSGTLCTQTYESGIVCVTSTCTGLPDDQNCSLGTGGLGGLCCGQSCLDTESDPQNCGQCYNACQPGTLCQYGSCETAVSSCADAPIGSLCQQGDGGAGSCCGTCGQLDVQTDPNNCGGCGYICSQGTSCVGGTCLQSDGGYGYCGAFGLNFAATESSCQAGDSCLSSGFCVTESCSASQAMEPCGGTSGPGVCCGSVCLDTFDDSANCGLCGTVCPTGQFCSSAQCVAVPICGPDNSGTACPLASNKAGVCCSGQCVDTSSDPDNCDGCGVACPVGQTCNCTAGEVCSAEQGYSTCGLADGGAAPSCYTGATCPAGTLCSQEECLPTTCAPGSTGVDCTFGISTIGTCCNGVCTDTTQDPANCGTCGTSCASGVCYTSLGSGAECLPSSDAGDSCNDGFGCQPGATCLEGSCVTSTGCQGPFGVCQAEDGNVGACCQNFFGATCTDLTSDPQNCGGCSVQCPSGQTCAGGLCSGSVSPCLAGRRDAYCDLDAGTSLLCCAGGGCVNVDSDPANCGYCGYACNPGLSCISSQCVATSCSSATAGDACEAGDGGQGGCCGTACLDLAADPDNCGACGTKCAQVETCQQGSCVIAQCSPTYQGAPCDVDGGGYLYLGSCCGTACADTQSDPANCGLCGNSCGDGGCNGGSCS